MLHHHTEVSLGFTDEKEPVGTHMCLVYTEDEERVDSLLKFLLSGLQGGERTACFSDKLTEETIREYLLKNHISYDERKAEKAITITGTSDVYFQNGVFDPDRMLNTLITYYKEAQELGFPASRLIGEMTPEIQQVPGGERLLEYESRVSILLRDHPVTTVCQYNANLFDGATILEVLKVHPKMIINGTVITNPFYIEPEAYLKGHITR
ncbi:MAG: MEDS domain-containing protein [Proteobacteria bacterium]|nr:MEDS domain-containing protein [Pseudomonadota bacterium]